MKTNVSVRILESDFQLVCDISEKPILVKSAKLLDNQLREFRRNNPAMDSEQLLLMGALRNTCELVSKVETLSDQAKVANAEIQQVLAQLEETNKS